MTTLPLEVPRGLEGVAVTDTTVGDVLGEEGRYHYRGYDAPTLARTRSFEDVSHLMLFGQLPDQAQGERFAERLATARARLEAPALRAIGTAIADAPGEATARLRSGWSLVGQWLELRPWTETSEDRRVDDAIALCALAPLVTAVAYRPEAPSLTDPTGGTVETYLRLVTGREPAPAEVRALERYLVLTIDHGLNASTFTARTIASTGTDLGSVVVGALGALAGPLHGGAPSRVLEMLDDIATPDRAERWLLDALARGERIMGFGHRAYRTEDPRATLLRETAQDLGGPRVELALHVEEVARRLLRDAYPDRPLDVNVEYHAALVLETVGVPPSMFTPTFSISRVVGWMAHVLEQLEGNRIIRPNARYVGPDHGGVR